MPIKKLRQITLTDHSGCELTVTALENRQLEIKAYSPERGPEMCLTKSQSVKLIVNYSEAEQFCNAINALWQGGEL